MTADVAQAVEALRRGLVAVRQADREAVRPLLTDDRRRDALNAQTKTKQAVVALRRDLDAVLIGADDD